MSVRRIVAIAIIYACACLAWTILGTTTAIRSEDCNRRLGNEVRSLWGRALVQRAPTIAVDVPGSDRRRWLMPASNVIRVFLGLEYRKKGLIWYSTYRCRFAGTWVLANEDDVAQRMRFHFDFPASGATYDSFAMKIDGKRVKSPIDTHEGIDEIIEVAAGARRSVEIRYETRGMGRWSYEPDARVGRIRELDLEVRTDFRGHDHPEGSLSPAVVRPEGEGTLLRWSASDLITSQGFGVTMPERMNPGPLASRITFFAPVCLIFFFALVAAIDLVCKVDVHPMHYLFVAAGFFAFHLLLVYLVDHVDVHVAFLLSAGCSVGLVSTYLAAALGEHFPKKVAVAGQLFYLVLFSYSFFLEGMAGLVGAIGSVCTLAVLMTVTSKIDWTDLFARGEGITPPPSGPAPTGPSTGAAAGTNPLAAEA